MGRNFKKRFIGLITLAALILSWSNPLHAQNHGCPLPNTHYQNTQTLPLKEHCPPFEGIVLDIPEDALKSPSKPAEKPERPAPSSTIKSRPLPKPEMP